MISPIIEIEFLAIPFVFDFAFKMKAQVHYYGHASVARPFVRR